MKKPTQKSFIDLTGDQFDRLMVLKYRGKRSGSTLWLCQCNCGNQKLVTYRELTNGDTRSCGCLRLERITRHGKTQTPEYHAWESMIARCYNPKNPRYHCYGDRGISVCDRWRFGSNSKSGSELFLKDMGTRPTPKHSLDRIQNDDGYRPGNCKWSTHTEQQANRRGLVRVIYKGDLMILSDAIRATGLRCMNLYHYRSKYGWTHQEAFDYILKNHRPHNYPRNIRRKIA